ncbi:cupredoxin family protein [Pseudomonas sp. 1928-m]|uniref:cupredoxin domain-containing protein n=1 Tax=Pseudomonas sp. 1928-m TaxID=3033804 RepID=UPI0023DF631F|nr:cupredoxin family protein [Pseudomonas sp. 1928-m]MDF3194858.1 cupredoxin family protein [Pseudomonas sp. 1928-m]
MSASSNSVALLLSLGLLLGASAALAAGEHHGTHHASAPAKQQKAWGIAGEPEQVSRTIEISMNDQMRFSPDQLEVKQGETIRFVHRNEGQVMHEFVLGTQAELQQHAAMMATSASMQHDSPDMAHVAPGQREELIWTFNRAGEFDFACLIPGHYQAGMVGKVRVLAN